MKTAINLRTREFVIAREFYWPRLLITLAIILVVTLFLGGSVFVYLYRIHLEVETKDLLQEKRDLAIAVAPLEELEMKISDLEKREKLIHSLEEELITWSGPLEMIYAQAQKNDLALTSIAAAPEGKVSIRGESPAMRKIALFIEDLEEKQAGATANYRHMNYAQNKSFTFEVELQMDLAAGGEQ